MKVVPARLKAVQSPDSQYVEAVIGERGDFRQPWGATRTGDSIRVQLDLNDVVKPRRFPGSSVAYLLSFRKSSWSSESAVDLRSLFTYVESMNDIEKKDNNPETIGDREEGVIQTLRLSCVLKSPFQPRLRPIGNRDVDELIASISAVGQLTPILVSPADIEGKYWTHAGHRRCAALRFLGKTSVKAMVRPEISEREARKLALADNLGRADLTAYEQAIALREFAKTFEIGFEAAAEQLGLQKRTAYRLKALLGGSEALLDWVRKAGIPAKPAALLVRLEAKSPRKAIGYARRYASGNLSSAVLEAELRKNSNRPSRSRFRKLIDLQQTKDGVSLRADVVFSVLSEEDRMRIFDGLTRFSELVSLRGEGETCPEGSAS